MRKQTKYYVFEAGLILMICICSLMLGMTRKQGTMLENKLHDQASAMFELIVITRQWNSEYGGVFVEKNDGVISNPYLENPDITDSNGKVYTKKNPALMTREISNISKFAEDFTFHITSLKLKNPDNAPDDWEKSTLLEFEKGEKEKNGIETQGDKKLYRLIRPLYVEKSCLECHKDQNYKIGEVRGGISVNLPYNMTLQAIRKNNIIMFSLLGFLIVIFLVTLYVFVWKVMDTLENQRIQLENLNQMKNMFLGMCAHDLRSPLGVIKGYSELILDDDQITLSDDHTLFIKRIHASSLKMSEMVDTLLNVSVIESGRLELHLSEGSLKKLLDEQIQMSRLFADKKNITIQSSLHVTPDISFDKDRITIVKKIVEYHKGKIEVESQPGNGSTFIVKLPVRDK